MNRRSILYFEDIDLDSEDFFSTEFLLENNTVALDLNFNNTLPKDKQINNFEKYASNLEEYKQKIDKAITKDFKDKETTFEYLSSHIDELDELTISNLLKEVDINKPTIERLLSTLKLERISIYFDENEFAVWDYSFGNDISNYILVVYTDQNGKVSNFTIDS